MICNSRFCLSVDDVTMEGLNRVKMVPVTDFGCLGVTEAKLSLSCGHCVSVS